MQLPVSTPSAAAPLVESLEGRRLLSASVTRAIMGYHPSKVETQVDAKAAAYAEAVARSIAIGKAHHITPSVRGDWTGKAKTTIFVVSKSADFELHITKVKPTYAEGTIEVAGHEYSGRLQGTTKPTHEFSYTYTKGKNSVKVEGLLNGLNTAATGTVTAKYSGWSIQGTFSVTKIKSIKAA